jgi:hypothetical protein
VVLYSARIQHYGKSRSKQAVDGHITVSVEVRRLRRLFFAMCRLPANNAVRFISMLKAILTDLQFWIPVGVLAVGVALLAWLH